MSVDILVFDKSKAPTEPMEFLKWFYKKSEWNSDRDYNDIKGTSQPLVDFFMELVKKYPSMNGEFAPIDEEFENDPELECERGTIYAVYEMLERYAGVMQSQTDMSEIASAISPDGSAIQR